MSTHLSSFDRLMIAVTFAESGLDVPDLSYLEVACCVDQTDNSVPNRQKTAGSKAED